MRIQPNTDMTGTASDWVGIVMLVVMFSATKPVKQLCFNEKQQSDMQRVKRQYFMRNLEQSDNVNLHQGCENTGCDNHPRNGSAIVTTTSKR